MILAYFAIMQHVMRSMVSSRSLLFLLVGFVAASAIAQGDTKARIDAHLKGSAAATRLAEQDSLNELIKQDLRILLDADDAMTAPFDDLPMSRVDAPDGAFRLFTWNLPRKDGTHRFEGFLIARHNSGQVLYELRDMTSGIPSPEVPELGPDRWYGALYYQVVPVNKGGKTYYTLLGWKGTSLVETQKVIDVLSFKGGRPRFGAPLFGTGKLKANRRVYAFSFQATMSLRYEPDQQRIVLDHLSPLRKEMEGQPAFTGPDLSYDAFVWDKGQWQFQRDIDARDRQRDGKPFTAPPREPRP